MAKIEKQILVVKHNSLINATSKYKYDTNELKLICCLIATINNQKEKDFETKFVNLKDLNFSDKAITNTTYITELCESVMSKPFRLGKGVYNWFSGLVYDSGVLSFRFDPDLKPFLLELKDNFTRYHINDILKLRSSYSIQVFELLTQYKTIGERTMTIKDLRGVLKIPDGYRNPDITRLLETIQSDLKQTTHLDFSFTFKKLGRSFHSINFAIKDNYEHIEKTKQERKKKRTEGTITLSSRLKGLKLEDH